MHFLLERHSAGSATLGVQKSALWHATTMKAMCSPATAHLEALALYHQPAANSAVAVTDAGCKCMQLVSPDLCATRCMDWVLVQDMRGSP